MPVQSCTGGNFGPYKRRAALPWTTGNRDLLPPLTSMFDSNVISLMGDLQLSAI